MAETIFLILGLVGLWLGTEFVLRGALNIAEYYNLSHIFIGLTILAIGTDLPELVIAINGSLQKLQGMDTSGVIVGNSIGSCFSQISLVLGISGIFGYLTLARRHIYQDGVMLIGSMVLIFLLGYDGEITKLEGFICITTFLVYYFRLFKREKLPGKLKKEKKPKLYLDIIYLSVGIAIVIATSEVVLVNALVISVKLELNQTFVGIIFLGLGTSLPELAISLNAALKKSAGISVGNLVGSNIFDLLMPLGVGSAISGLNFDASLLWFDIPCLLILTILVFVFFLKKKGLQKWEAISLILLYAAYATLKLIGF